MLLQTLCKIFRNNTIYVKSYVESLDDWFGSGNSLPFTYYDCIIAYADADKRKNIISDIYVIVQKKL